MDKSDQLIEILLDDTAREDERHDSAMYLSSYAHSKVINALAKIASSSEEPDWLRDTCAESIAEIWIQLDIFDIEVYDFLTPIAQNTIRAVLNDRKPSLLPKRLTKIIGPNKTA